MGWGGSSRTARVLGDMALFRVNHEDLSFRIADKPRMSTHLAADLAAASAANRVAFICCERNASSRCATAARSASFCRPSNPSADKLIPFKSSPSRSAFMIPFGLCEFGPSRRCPSSWARIAPSRKALLTSWCSLHLVWMRLKEMYPRDAKEPSESTTEMPNTWFCSLMGDSPERTIIVSSVGDVRCWQSVL